MMIAGGRFRLSKLNALGLPLQIRRMRRSHGPSAICPDTSSECGAVHFDAAIKIDAARHCRLRFGTPQLNGKAERSHRSDWREFYQRLKYRKGVGLQGGAHELWTIISTLVAPSKLGPILRQSGAKFRSGEVC